MRKKTRKLLIMLTVLAFLVIDPVKAQQYLRINQSDGNVLEIAIADIQKLTFDLVTAIQQYPDLAKQLIKIKAYPNPAKAYAILDYYLHESGEVMIELFTMQGLLIERLYEDMKQPGNYQYRLETQHLASGTYLCRVQQNNESLTQKIVVKH